MTAWRRCELGSGVPLLPQLHRCPTLAITCATWHQGPDRVFIFDGWSVGVDHECAYSKLCNTIHLAAKQLKYSSAIGV